MENDGVVIDRSRSVHLWSSTDHKITHLWSKKAIANTYRCNPDEFYVSPHDVEILGDCLVLVKQDFYDHSATHVIWTGQRYEIKKRVDNHHAPYVWRPTSKRRKSIGAD